MILSSLSRGSRRHHLLAAVAVAALSAPVAAHATTIPAPNAPAFDHALATARGGDVIQLAPTGYPQLLIRRRVFPSTVKIVGVPGTRLSGLVIKDSRNIELDTLTVSPADNNRATVGLYSSSFITLDHVAFNGRVEAAGAGMSMDPSSTDVVIRNGEFTNCGFGTRCFAPAGTRVTLANNNFHDCYDCDFVRGGGIDVSITGNTFDRAQPGTCTGGTTVCPHDDLMQIMGGAHYQIVGNHFGARAAGAAQLFIGTGLNSKKGPDDVYAANNTFDGGSMGYAMRVGGTPLPTNVRIVNNTVLTGDISSLRLSDDYARVAQAARPLVANNIFQKITAVNCPLGNFTSNLVVDGVACGTSDRLGDPHLAANEMPTALSTLVLGLADLRYAPTVDKLGHARLPQPDRGALQHAG